MLTCYKNDQNAYFVTYENIMKANVLSRDFTTKFLKILEEIKSDPDARALIFETKGHTFSAGADLNWFRELRDMETYDAQKDIRKLFRIYEQISYLPVPTIVKVQGGAFGGAVALLSSFDIVCASEDSFFQFPEVRFGILPSLAFWPLRRKISIERLKSYFLVADSFTVQKAHLIGLVDYVFDSSSFHKNSKCVINRTLSADLSAQKEVKKIFKNGHCFAGDELSGLLVKKLKAISSIELLDPKKRKVEDKDDFSC